MMKKRFLLSALIVMTSLAFGASWCAAEEAAAPADAVEAPEAEAAGEDGGAVDAEPVTEETFDSLVAAAAEAFGEKRYDAAMGFFERAYALDPDPAILFNLGLIADKKGDIDAALTYLNDFVLIPDIDVNAREEALQRLDQLNQLKELRDQKAGGDEKVADKKDPEPGKSTPPPPAVEEPPSLIGPIIVTSVGVALVAGGGIVGVMAQGKHDDFEAATTLDDRRAAADDGEMLSTVADSLYIGGGLVAASGLVWLILRASAGDEPAPVAIAPSIAPSAAGLSMQIVF